MCQKAFSCSGVSVKYAIILFTVSTMAFIASAGCTPQVGASKSGSIAGKVIKGPVTGAEVIAYAIDDGGGVAPKSAARPPMPPPRF